MKKSIWIAFGYAIAAMACGVFYREFTKFFEFTGTTTLSVTHVHLFMLGAVIFLVVALFNSKLHLEQSKLWKPFLVVYNIGLPFMVATFIAKGIMQVVGYDGGAMMSGIAGAAHVTMAAGVVLFFIMLLKTAAKNKAGSNTAA